MWLTHHLDRRIKPMVALITGIPEMRYTLNLNFYTMRQDVLGPNVLELKGKPIFFE